MTLEEFIRAHMTTGKKDFILHVAIDPNTSKLTAQFDDNEPDGGVAHCRIEANVLTLQSFDTAEEKRRIADEAKAEADKKKLEAEEAAAKARDAEAAAKASEK